MDNKLVKIVATAAAVAFIAAPVTSTLAHAKHAKVACYGTNSCKGKGACKTSANACKGKNSCKGKGMEMMSAKKCAKKNGTTTEQDGSQGSQGAQGSEAPKS